MLFSCNTTGGKIIRSYTGANFDHAAMVLKFEGSNPKKKNEVYILEANSSGVGIKKWSNLRQSYGDFYKKIVIRHINFDRTDKCLEILGQVLLEVNGKKYSFRPR